MGLPGSVALRQAEAAGLRGRRGGLRGPRLHPGRHAGLPAQPGAVLHDPAQVAANMLRLATEGAVRAVDGSILKIRPKASASMATPPAPWPWPPR